MGAGLTKIVTGLYIGCISDENDNESMILFTHIVTTYSDDTSPNLVNDNNFVRKLLKFNERDPVSLMKLFPEAISFICEARSRNGTNILINGHSGSMANIAVSIAYLVTEFQKLDLTSAILLMQSKVVGLVIDDWIYTQLEEFETPGKHPELKQHVHGSALPSLKEQRSEFLRLLSSLSAENGSYVTGPGDWLEITQALSSIDRTNHKNLPTIRRRTNTQSSMSDNSKPGSHSTPSYIDSTAFGSTENQAFIANEQSIFSALKKDLTQRLDSDLFNSDPNDFLDLDERPDKPDHASTEDFNSEEEGQAIQALEEDDFDEDAIEIPGSIAIPQRMQNIGGIRSYMPSSSFMPSRTRQVNHDPTIERGLDANALTESNKPSFQYSRTAPVKRFFP